MPKKAHKNGHTPEPVTLKGELFWKYRAVDSDYVRIQHQLKAANDEIAVFIEKTPDLKDIFARRAELLNQSSVAQTELQECLQAIEKRIGMSLKNCSIDDKTGVVHTLKDGENIPLMPQKKTDKSKRRAGTAK
jgi:hypothetical protein